MTEEPDADSVLAEALAIVEALSIAHISGGSMADLEAMAFHDRLEDPNLSLVVTSVFAAVIATFARHIAEASNGQSGVADRDREAAEIIQRTLLSGAFRAVRRPPDDLPPDQ